MGKKLRVQPDIIISGRNVGSVLLDTNYRGLNEKPDESEVAQMTLYSISTGIKNCVLICTGISRPQKILSQGWNKPAYSII
jgi:hypothetical protein